MVFEPSILMLLGIIHFSDTITLGTTLVFIAVAIAGGLSMFKGARWQANYKVEKARADSLEDGREAYHLRAQRLEEEREAAKKEAEEQRDAKHQAGAELAAEKMKTDLTVVMKQMADQHTALVSALTDGRREMVREVSEQLRRHEDRALERHEGIVAAMKEIGFAFKNGNNGHA